tara:strand:- start:7093 stop:7563 length:471 start_codon:yes stop_codon:yes gene_type:complete
VSEGEAARSGSPKSPRSPQSPPGSPAGGLADALSAINNGEIPKLSPVENRKLPEKKGNGLEDALSAIKNGEIPKLSPVKNRKLPEKSKPKDSLEARMAARRKFVQGDDGPEGQKPSPPSRAAEMIAQAQLKSGPDDDDEWKDRAERQVWDLLSFLI